MSTRILHRPSPASPKPSVKCPALNPEGIITDSRSNSRHRSCRSSKLSTLSISSSSSSYSTLDEDSNYDAQQDSEMPAKPTRPSSSAGSSDDGNSVRYTKTGRVSKALKGQPVHKCDICNKYYTRAEHLRRHQLNHKGARPWLCDVPGCDKGLPNRGFYREDLLLRHMEDHKSSYDHHFELGLDTCRTQTPSTFSDNPTVNLISPVGGSDMFSHCSLSEASFGGSFVNAYSPMLSSCLDTPGLYESPPPEQASSYQPYFLTPGLHGDVWNHTSFDMNRSASPASVVSSFTNPGWPGSELRAQIPMLSLSDSDNSTYATTDSSRHDVISQTSSEISNQGISTADLDAFDLMRINQDAEGLLAALGEPQVLATFAYLQELYLPLFWQKFYPTFPIIHRPSFDASHTLPPLLKALMTAIGASYVNTPGARIVARTLRDTCVKLVDKRPAGMLRAGKIWDLHILFLLEAFLLYRSRRPAVAPSKRFEMLCTMLRGDEAVSPTKHCEDLAPMAFTPDDAAAAGVQGQWILNEMKRRLFLACYVFDTKRSLLFQQPRTIQDELPHTCSPQLWEARDLRSWREITQAESFNSQQLDDNLYQRDTFSAAIITAYGTGNDQFFQNASQRMDSIASHPRNLLSYHAMLMASHTPVRDLLAVSGETFVLGEKLPASGQYEQATLDLQLWVQSENAAKAMFHATRVLGTAFESGRCGLLHEEWVLYIAALVCWACGMWMQREQNPEQELQRSMKQSPALGADEQMDAFLHRNHEGGAAEQDQSQNLNDWTGTRSCLIWVQKRISGQVGGLVEDAVTVLDRLINNRVN